MAPCGVHSSSVGIPITVSDSYTVMVRVELA